MNSLQRTFSFIINHPVGQKRPLYSVVKWLIWQLKSNINPGPHLIPFIGNTKLLVSKGQTGATGNVYVGLHEFNDMGFLLHYLKEGDVFFDVGANVGVYTILASGYCKAVSYSFEPVPSTFKTLQANLNVNKLSGTVYAHNIAAGNKNGKLRFTANEDTTNHVVLENAPGTDTIEVEVKTLDELNYPCPKIIKIDVEGFETEVLAGAKTILGNADLKVLIIELNGSGERYRYNESLIHEMLLEIGFTCCQYDPFTRELNRTESFGKHNTIYVRDFETTQTELRAAPKFKISGLAI